MSQEKQTHQEVSLQQAIHAMTTMKYFADLYPRAESIIDKAIPREDFEFFYEFMKDKQEFTGSNAVLQSCIETVKGFIQQQKETK